MKWASIVWIVAVAGSESHAADPASGPLRVHPTNPRYFADAAGRAVYLVGSHTWANFQDIGFEGDKPFDYDAYLAFMEQHQFNFMRLWTWEHAAWATWSPEKVIFGPMPYRRPGPGLALDGKPKFDLDQFDEAYFDRMRARILKARDRGIYCAVMLFQAFSYARPKPSRHTGNPYPGHYYNARNNVKNLESDKNGDSVLDLDDPAVRARQEAYVRKVVDTVNDLDNVLYEVINEGGTEGWQFWVTRVVKDCEAAKPKRHPVGITGQGAVKLPAALAGPCDWVSPGNGDMPGVKFNDFATKLRGDPPAWWEKKPSVHDTDHIWGHGIDSRWVWKSFVRGHNVLFMDPWGPLPGWFDPRRNVPDYPDYPPARAAMRRTAALARRLDLAAALPHGELASSGFCLADRGKEYVVYLPTGDAARVDLSGAGGVFGVEWLNPVDGRPVPADRVEGGGWREFKSPLSGDVVLYLKATTPTGDRP